MLKINGRMYVKGTVNITPVALSRLAEMGVVPPENRFPQGGAFDSFFLPEGEDGAEFLYRGGNPATAGRLALVSETVETFVATGDEMQQAFASRQEAQQAAQNAPWADGRVFRHECRPEDFSGFGEIGGEQVQ